MASDKGLEVPNVLMTCREYASQPPRGKVLVKEIADGRAKRWSVHDDWARLGGFEGVLLPLIVTKRVNNGTRRWMSGSLSRTSPQYSVPPTLRSYGAKLYSRTCNESRAQKRGIMCSLDLL